MNCPCGLIQQYSNCCQFYHNGAIALTAEQLMRSRYTAYVLNLKDYVYQTWHYSTRPSILNDDEQGLKWLGLTVKRAWGASDDEAFVEFVARYKVGGKKAERLHEISRFVYEDGCWFYVNGEFPNGC